jgi:hypothetical protein
VATPGNNTAVSSVRGSFGDSNKAVLNAGELFAFKAMLIKERMKDEMAEDTMPSNQFWEAAVRIILGDGSSCCLVPAKYIVVVVLLVVVVVVVVVVVPDYVVDNVVNDAHIFDKDRKWAGRANLDLNSMFFSRLCRKMCRKICTVRSKLCPWTMLCCSMK